MPPTGVGGGHAPDCSKRAQAPTVARSARQSGPAGVKRKLADTT